MIFWGIYYVPGSGTHTRKNNTWSLPSDIEIDGYINNEREKDTQILIAHYIYPGYLLLQNTHSALNLQLLIYQHILKKRV